MRRTILCAVSLLALAVPADGQYGLYGGYGARDASQTVAQWYQRFLGRQPDPYAGGWVTALQSGQNPEQVLAGILGSQEYYLRTGGTPRAFVNGLYADLAGRAPTPQEESYWTRQVHSRSREDVAYDFLTRQAQNWDRGGGDRSWEDRYDYRRPSYRYR